MSERRFRRTPGGVCALGLHLVWCPKYRRRVLAGRVAARCGELLEQIADEHGWEIVAKEGCPIICTCSPASGLPTRPRR